MMKKNKQSGQSTIEFIFTFSFGVAIVFLVFKSAINSASGYLVHYATFMASRTYLTFDDHLGNVQNAEIRTGAAEALAAEVFEQYNLPIFDVPNNAFSINHSTGLADEYLTVGGKTIFTQPIDMIGQIAGQGELEMVSESFLGKEPTRAQCANRTCYGITGNTQCNMSYDITLYDNGC